VPDLMVLPRYGALTVFTMEAICHLGFERFKILTFSRVNTISVHHLAKFRGDNQTISEMW